MQPIRDLRFKLLEYLFTGFGSARPKRSFKGGTFSFNVEVVEIVEVWVAEQGWNLFGKD